MSIQALSQSLAAKGRNGDSMLVHMAPREVAGLQALAQANGTSLSINPDTGMPEAFSLKQIIPLVAAYFLGPAAGTLLGTSAAAGSAIVSGLGTAAMTGDIKKGIVAGLGAYGASTLAGSLSNLATPAAPAPIENAVLAQGSQAVPGLTAGPTAPQMASVAPITTPGSAPSAAIASPLVSGGEQIVKDLVQPSGSVDNFQFDMNLPKSPVVAPTVAAPAVAPSTSPAAPTLIKPPIGSGSAGDYIPAPAGQPAAAVAPGFPSKIENPITLGNISSGFENLRTQGKVGEFLMQNKMPLLMATLPFMTDAQAAKDPSSRAMIRPYDLAIDNRSGEVARYAPGSSSEQQLLSYAFTPQDPYLASEYEQKRQFFAAKGGEIKGLGALMAKGGTVLNDGDFVFDARTVSEIGNGSTDAGQKILAARFNAQPVKGPGDGVSDSIRANIGGVQKARIANGEAVVPAREVKRAGGAKKLYALMDKAHQARKKAGRGVDTKIGRQLLA
jgi:hypothetical protein